jgi:hypothetical protein
VLRDRDQREGVYLAQLYERRALQERIDEQRREQRQILMQAGRAIGRSFSAPVREARPAPVRAPSRDRGADDDFGL